MLPSDIVQQYTKLWRDTILSGLQYETDTLFVDFPRKDQQIDPNQTYAFSTFVKPGTHKVYVFDKEV